MKSANLLEEAKAVNASLHRVRKNLHVSLSQSEQAANQLAFDGNLISETLNSHQHDIKHALASTKIRLDRIKRAEEYEKYVAWISLGFFTLVVAYILLSRFHIFYLIRNFIGCQLFSSSTLKSLSDSSTQEL